MSQVIWSSFVVDIVDLEKAGQRVPREILWAVLRATGHTHTYACHSGTIFSSKSQSLYTTILCYGKTDNQESHSSSSHLIGAIQFV